MFQQKIQGSHLLNALPEADWLNLVPHLDEVELAPNHILYEPADKVCHVYFPRDHALAAHIVVMPDGTAIEAAIVGSEGVVEGIVSRGNMLAFSRVRVTHGGAFYRMSASVLQDIKQKSPQVNDLFAQYADCLVAQLLQSTACNATHSIEQRAASWLSAAMDRLGKPDIALTHDQLGMLLGVGRTYVSRVIGRMKGQGVIDTRRGGIRVIDRDGLDRTSCGCRHLVASHFNAVFNGDYPAANTL